MKGWAKTTRICVMMALDTAFLVLELGVGYYVSSLALIADGFHMLNDIISLAVGLWAVNLARKESNDRFSYGWLRAEILGAFFNATFLIGLCVTIVLEAIQRFFEPPDIKSPQIILIVGFCGLVSNLVGFWVLGGHGHSHGGADHDHDHDEEAGHDHDDVHAHDDHNDHVGHVHNHSADHGHAHADSAVEDGVDDLDDCPDEDNDEDSSLEATGPTAATTTAVTAAATAGIASDSRHVSFTPYESAGASVVRSASRASARRRANNGRRVPTSIEDISIHPASFRQDLQEIISARQTPAQNRDEDETDSDSAGETTPTEETAGAGAAVNASAGTGATERTPLLATSQHKGAASGSSKHGHSHSRHDSHDHDHTHGHAPVRARRDSHGGHHHNAPKDPRKAGGHSHGDMGMNAMVLHVIGDALGNIGVIVTALIIWKTEWTFRMYADPIVSLLITVIILRSAIPLTKATSKILLQATPDHIDINDIREDVQDLDGVLSCHHVHVWQLSDSQIVASLHIEVSFPISEYGGEKYMKLARRIRKCLHAYGIHSATIQPEFRLGAGAGAALTGPAAAAAPHDALASLRGRSPPTSPHDGHDAATAHTAGSAASDGASEATAAHPSCLLDCVDDCVAQGCCSQTSRAGSRTGSPPGDHDGHSL